jgi:hypothetical protein
MVNLLIFIFVCYGFCNSIIFGSIFEKWRNFWLKNSPNFFGKLMTCFICLPWYGGFILSLVGLSPMESTGQINDINIFDLFIIPTKFICVFFDGALASGTNWLIHTIQEHFEKDYIRVKLEKEEKSEIEKEMD